MSTPRNRVFDDDYNRQQQKRRSKLREKRAAKVLGGKRHALSGASEKAKGDLSTDMLVGEHKYTDKKSLSVKRDWLEKVAIEAMAVGKVPAFVFTFGQWDNAPLVPREWVAVPADFLRELMEATNG